jgi:exodeoxyribonuclease VII small subunit
MDNEVSYEMAFERLEKILNLLNENKESLEDSIKLFEEANGLINKCNKKLSAAEKKIETLIKSRDGSLTLDDDKMPLKQAFPSESDSLFNN